MTYVPIYIVIESMKDVTKTFVGENKMPQLNTESPTYMQDTMTRISLALGYDGESNQQCWDWIMAVSDKYGNDFLDEKMHGILEHYDESGYLGVGKEFRKK